MSFGRRLAVMILAAEHPWPVEAVRRRAAEYRRDDPALADWCDDLADTLPPDKPKSPDVVERARRIASAPVTVPGDRLEEARAVVAEADGAGS